MAGVEDDDAAGRVFVGAGGGRGGFTRKAGRESSIYNSLSQIPLTHSLSDLEI